MYPLILRILEERLALNDETIRKLREKNREQDQQLKASNANHRYAVNVKREIKAMHREVLDIIKEYGDEENWQKDEKGNYIWVNRKGVDPIDLAQETLSFCDPKMAENGGVIEEEGDE